MISLDYEFFTEYELDAFFAAFFKFVEAVATEDSNSIIMSALDQGPVFGRHVQFENESLARQFANYWQKRKTWLGLDQYEMAVG